MMLERQREGVAKAKAQGRYKGRKPSAHAKAGKVRQLRAEGVRPVEIARKLGISRASVYRCLADVSAAPA
jgi:DNA invertase Pin-like site-specific DNA recombinase